MWPDPLWLLLLLLPVAAASGWYAARRAERRANALGGGCPPEYFKGINFLLNEQPDKATEVFVRMAEVDSATVEPHFALGNLFRRQGEVDRAIRLHQNLIARPALPQEQRNQALFELAEDYLQAGLLDRAENLFHELTEDDPRHTAALRRLVAIYEQLSDWERAISTATTLESMTGFPSKAVIANYYCELAEQARSNGDTARAKKMLKRAYGQDSDCVRASILAGEIARDNGNCKAAIKAFKRVERSDAVYLSEVVEPLLDCYEQIDRFEEGTSYLRGALSRQQAFKPVLIFAEHLRRHEGEEAAQEFVAEYLQAHPSLPGLAHLVESLLSRSDAERHREVQTVNDVLMKLLEDIPIYVCSNCGFKGMSMRWQCPSCRCWGCVKPYQGQTG